MSSTSFELDMAEANYLFAAIKAAGRNLRPLMNEIGSALEDSTRQRFRTERSPDGARWTPISQEWRAEKAERGLASGILKMRGDLLNSVRYDPPTDNSVTLVASTPYAAAHQFGATIRPRRGKALKVRGRLLSSVRIPARPYLGLSADDRTEVLDAARDFLARAARR